MAAELVPYFDGMQQGQGYVPYLLANRNYGWRFYNIDELT